MDIGETKIFTIGRGNYFCKVIMTPKGYYMVGIFGNRNETLLSHSYKGKKIRVNPSYEELYDIVKTRKRINSDLDSVIEEDVVMTPGPQFVFKSSDSEKYSPVFGRNIKGGKK